MTNMERSQMKRNKIKSLTTQRTSIKKEKAITDVLEMSISYRELSTTIIETKVRECRHTRKVY